MSFSGEVLSGTYLEKLLQKYPDYRPSDFWSLICCGSDLHHPYDGWAGVVAVPVYSDVCNYEAYFGDFPESLEQYENVPRCRINYDTSKIQAFSEFRSYISTHTNNPVFISANAKTWALRIINDAVSRDTEGPWNAQLLCLRDVFSLTSSEGKLMSSTYLGDSFSGAKKLSKTFGLHAIAEAVGVQVPDSSTKALHRARLTALAAEECLNHEYHSE